MRSKTLLFKQPWRRTLALAALLSCAAHPAHATPSSTSEDPQGYALWTCGGTDSKPQSKLWFNDGAWWCIIDSPDGNRIFQLRGTRWVPQTTPDAILGPHSGRADVVWDGARLEVLLWDKLPQFFEYKYKHKKRHYVLQRGYPVPLPIPDDTETMTIDRDSKGRIWGTYASHCQVYVTHSEKDHHKWNLPGQVLQDGISPDDISSIIAFGGNRIGVMWSDQKRWEFGFRRHKDDAPFDAWGPNERVYPGKGHTDDHIHMTTDSKGNLYAITKDEHHGIDAHMRRPNGTWKTQGDVLGTGHATRPILMTAEDDGRLVLLYTRWHQGTDIISYRTAPLGTLDFGPGLPFICVPGVNLNDVTGTKQRLPHGSIIAIADGKEMAWWNGFGLPADDTGATAHFRACPLPICSATAAVAFAFDEGAGSEVGDSSEHGHIGRLGGPWANDLSEPEWVDGVAGKALRFDGGRSIVQVADTPALDIAGSITVEAWVRRAPHATREAVLCKGENGVRTYQVRIFQNNEVEFMRSVQGGKDHTLVSKPAPDDSLWHHFACVYDSEGKQSRVYVDGHLDVAAPDSGVSVVDAGPLCIGVRIGEHDFREWFTGDIDQLRITPGVRYTADFTPQPGFETGGGAKVFLSWTPHFTGGEPPAYDLYRGVAGGPLAKLNGEPLHVTSFIDVPPQAGRVVYELRAEGVSKAHGEAALDWPPPGLRSWVSSN